MDEVSCSLVPRVQIMNHRIISELAGLIDMDVCFSSMDSPVKNAEKMKMMMKKKLLMSNRVSVKWMFRPFSTSNDDLFVKINHTFIHQSP